MGARFWAKSRRNFEDAPHKSTDFLQNFQDAPHGSAILSEEVDGILRTLRTGPQFLIGG